MSAHVPSFFGTSIAALGIALVGFVLSQTLSCCLRLSQAIILTTSPLQLLNASTTSLIHKVYKILLPPPRLHSARHHQLLSIAALLFTQHHDSIRPR